jgi:hypothetical protein
MTAAVLVLFLHHLGRMRNGAFGKTNDFTDRLSHFCVVWERNEIIATGLGGNMEQTDCVR